MKNKLLLTIAVVIVIIGFATVVKYNTIVGQDEAVSNAWSNVESQYQRRADLIPNLVNTVKGYAAHEQQTLKQVIAARAKATGVTLDANHLTPEALQQYQAAQGEVTQALSRLMVVSERYPDLKASEQFSELQAQLEGTENRINEARRAYNAQVQTYNVSIRRFPANIIASIMGFTVKAPFAADPSAAKAPNVTF